MKTEESVLRSCDGCTACCYTHTVGELEKWEFTPCDLCTESGCSIYNSRPRACGAFFCAWAVHDVGRHEERPDRVGVVCSTIFTRFTDADPPLLLMMEAWPGALEQTPAKALLARTLASGTAVRSGTKSGVPRWQYHVARNSMQQFGYMLEQKNLKVVWHEL